MTFTVQMTKPTVSKHWRKPVGRRDQAWIPPEPLHHGYRPSKAYQYHSCSKQMLGVIQFNCQLISESWSDWRSSNLVSVITYYVVGCPSFARGHRMHGKSRVCPEFCATDNYKVLCTEPQPPRTLSPPLLIIILIIIILIIIIIHLLCWSIQQRLRNSSLSAMRLCG